MCLSSNSGDMDSLSKRDAELKYIAQSPSNGFSSPLRIVNSA
jgi:hypothetical protein